MVCIGNICRSPAAEGFFKNIFESKSLSCDVQSAGIKAMVNHGPDPHSKNIMLNNYQIDISEHKARQINEQMMRYHDLILVMDEEQAGFLRSRYPFASGKVHRIGKWRQMNITDPYRQSELVFEEKISQIHDSVNDWIEKFW